MPQFDAFEIVEGLECKLKPFADFEETIPEPSDRQIGEFLKGIKELMSGALKTMGIEDGVDLTDPAQMMTALDQLEPDKFVEVQDTMAQIHAALCGEERDSGGNVTTPGRPSKAQILCVPMRRRNLFYQWLQGEVMNPEAATSAGNAQVMILPRAAGA
jgi:hypothetical protein